MRTENAEPSHYEVRWETDDGDGVLAFPIDAYNAAEAFSLDCDNSAVYLVFDTGADEFIF